VTMPTLKEIATALAPTINERIEQFEATASNSQIAAFGAELRQLLKDNGLLYTDRKHWSRVGVHPCNRHRTMLDPVRVHELLYIITKGGWSYLETMLALASEIPPNKNGEEARRKNVELHKASEGLLPECKADLLEILSVACTHTNSTLKVAGTGGVHCLAGMEALGGADGIISFESIVERSASMKEPLEKGMTWDIVRWQIVELCPKLMEILSEADNNKHDTFRKESPMTTMLNIHARAKMWPQGETIDYVKIASQVSRAHKEEYREDCKHYAAFVENWSGGKEGTLLNELDAFTKTLKVSVNVPADFYGSLAKVTMTRIPFFIIGMVKAALNSPDKFVVKSIVKLFDTKDINMIVSDKKDQVLKAHAIMVRARELLIACASAHSTDANDGSDEEATPVANKYMILISNLDIRLVMFVHNKKVPGKRVFISLHEIAVQFWDDLNKEDPQGTKGLSCPWATVKIANGVATPSSGAQGTLRELTMDRASAIQMGYTEKTKIHLASDSSKVFIIISLGRDSCSLQEAGQGVEGEKKNLNLTYSELLDDYKPVVSTEDAS
jgi:hypothetical protein